MPAYRLRCRTQDPALSYPRIIRVIGAVKTVRVCRVRSVEKTLKHRVRAALKRGRGICKSKDCKDAVVTCLGCLKRGCRHRLTAAGYIDLETGEDVGNITFARLTGESHKLMSLGGCQNCKGNGGVDRAAGIKALASFVKSLLQT